MIAADRSMHGAAKLLSLERGRQDSATSAREDLPALLRAGDLVVANDAATLPASLSADVMPRPARRSSFGSRDGSRPATRRASSQSCSAPAIIARARRTGRLRRVSPQATRSRSGPLARDRRAHARPSAPRRGALRRNARRDLGRHRAARAADPVFPRPRAARALGRLDEDRRAPDRLRAALSRLRARLAHARRVSRARHRLRHADPRRGDFLDRRPAARRQAPLRRAVPHPRRDAPRNRPHEAARRADHRHRHDRRARARSGSARTCAPCVPAMASPPDASGRRRGSKSSTRSSPACTRRARATSSSSAPSPTTMRCAPWPPRPTAHGYRNHEFGNSVLIERSARAAEHDELALPGNRTRRTSRAEPAMAALTTPMIGP